MNSCDQGTKMEAVACGEHTMMISNYIVEGETYDFLRIGCAPTYGDPLRYSFHLCLDYFVSLSQHTIINVPPITIWILIYPQTWSFYEGVYQQPADTFVGTLVH
jgi:hypothetical protein